MDEILARVWQDLIDRTTGPMWFRLILQPLVATALGIRAGRANARRASSAAHKEGVLDPAYRRAMFRQAVGDIGKAFIAGFVLDSILQVIMLGTLYPGEAMFVSVLLVVVPYQLTRTVVAWLAR